MAGRDRGKHGAFDKRSSRSGQVTIGIDEPHPSLAAARPGQDEHQRSGRHIAIADRDRQERDAETVSRDRGCESGFVHRDSALNDHMLTSLPDVAVRGQKCGYRWPGRGADTRESAQAHSATWQLSRIANLSVRQR